MDEEADTLQAMRMGSGKLVLEPRSLTLSPALSCHLPSPASLSGSWLGPVSPGHLSDGTAEALSSLLGLIGPVILTGWGPWCQELTKGTVPPPQSPRCAAASFYMSSHSCRYSGMWIVLKDPSWTRVAKLLLPKVSKTDTVCFKMYFCLHLYLSKMHRRLSF